MTAWDANNQLIESVDALTDQLDHLEDQVEDLVKQRAAYEQAYTDTLVLLAAVSSVIRDKGAPAVADVIDRRVRTIEETLDPTDPEALD